MTFEGVYVISMWIYEFGPSNLAAYVRD